MAEDQVGGKALLPSFRAVAGHHGGAGDGLVVVARQRIGRRGNLLAAEGVADRADQLGPLVAVMRDGDEVVARLREMAGEVRVLSREVLVDEGDAHGGPEAGGVPRLHKRPGAGRHRPAGRARRPPQPAGRRRRCVQARIVLSPDQEEERAMAGDRSRDDTGSNGGGVKPSPGDDAAPGTPGTGENVCPACKGSGRLGNDPCPNCSGTGVVIEGVGGG